MKTWITERVLEFDSPEGRKRVHMRLRSDFGAFYQVARVEFISRRKEFIEERFTFYLSQPRVETVGRWEFDWDVERRKEEMKAVEIC